MIIKVTSCLLLKLDRQSQLTVTAALRLAFPDTEIATVHTIDDAGKRPERAGLELLILSSDDHVLVSRAAAMNDKNGLRRWGVIVLGDVPPAANVTVVPATDADKQSLARAFCSAAVQHKLIRENARLRGDLLTIAGRVCHDLRSPLGAIINSAEMLKEIAREQDPKSAALAKPLFDSIDDLGRLIARVSQVTKASSNPGPKQRLSMEKIIWLVLQRHERQILKRSAVLSYPDTWPEVDGVSSWLELIWVNLVGNSLAHGREGVNIELGWSRQEDGFRFWVNDDGEGIPPEKVANLFQPFHMLHKLDARKGLGLSIVQRLLELQNGTCGYSRRPQGGSNFYFTLPAEPSPAASGKDDPANCLADLSVGENHA